MSKTMRKELKLKKGDFVRVDPPMVGRIKRVTKSGYVVEVLASPNFEVSFYNDSNLFKATKRSEWVREAIKYSPRVNQAKKK